MGVFFLHVEEGCTKAVPGMAFLGYNNLELSFLLVTVTVSDHTPCLKSTVLKRETGHVLGRKALPSKQMIFITPTIYTLMFKFAVCVSGMLESLKTQNRLVSTTKDKYP